ncbi:type IV-A pilus assembly ATPase PilB [Marinospirillum insulare]|uniref:Type IV-A pilus assembly ATPase PilB n=1 Tax=Marinospirillum insulare TaxID=217169 RepID=A0ABQ5ZT21_9GAMM|nr:type IV-A pilus assembly ATPase PilB [Marinospirillum insulare]GLR63109.1 type IV-A pilus assembly ATPase PilB [Marinospirillum insulare]
MVDTTNANLLSSLSRRLIREGLLDEHEALSAQADAKQKNLAYIHYLSSTGRIDSDLLAYLVAEEFGLPYLDLDTFDSRYLPKKIVDEQLLRKHQALPLLQRENILNLALSTPTNLAAIDEIQFQTGLIINPIIVSEEKLHQALEASLETDIGALGDLDNAELEALEVDNTPVEDDNLSFDGSQDDAPIVKFVNKILLDAVRKGASDIHFEPFEHSYRIRSRIDGILHEVTRPPLSLRGRLAARIKVMARMNISERRIPQDGSIKLKISKTRSLDFRVNTLPTLWGEKLVLRILDASSAKLGIEQLGFDADQRELYEQALAKPQGMILVTGPTGSGKTVSLYTGLNILNTTERNISSAEDPVEINMEGINQVNVNAKVGLTFASALRAFLRQDPDVVMVGEIRDLETAEIAIKAAQTGHLVLSTLHTNSASATINRLMNMGIPTYNLAASLQLIIAQRLARKLCEKCKAPCDTPKQVLLNLGFTEEELSNNTIYKAVGCSQCTSGYKGRSGIYEVVKITDALADLIMQGASAREIDLKAREEGFIDLRKAGQKKVLAGILSIDELTRVTME